MGQKDYEKGKADRGKGVHKPPPGASMTDAALNIPKADRDTQSRTDYKKGWNEGPKKK